MEPKSMEFEIVSANEGIIWSRKVAGVILPTSTGSMGVLPDHAGAITTIEPGLLQVKELDGSTTPILVYNGTAMVRLNIVLVTVDQVERIGKEHMTLEEAVALSAKVTANTKTILENPDKSFEEKRIAGKDVVFACARVSGYMMLKEQGRL